MKKEYIIFVLGIAVIVLGIFMLRGSEDTWICENGEWVKHGNPAEEKPVDPCDTASEFMIQPGEVFDAARSAKAIFLIRMNSPESSLFDIGVVEGTEFYNYNGERGVFEDVERGDFVVAVGEGDENSMIADEVLFMKKDEPSFSGVGNITEGSSGNEEGVPYFLYEEPGAPANSLRLSFADFSVCDFATPSPSCEDVGSTPEVFSGMRVEVVGRREGNTLYVLYLGSLESEGGAVNQSGRTSVDWELAKSYIRDCEVEQVSQFHSREVHLDLKDGRELITVEPDLDIVFDVVQDYTDKCGDIIMATE